LKTKLSKNRKNYSVLAGALMLAIVASTVFVLQGEPIYYAHAYTKATGDAKQLKLLVTGNSKEALLGKSSTAVIKTTTPKVEDLAQQEAKKNSNGLEKELYQMVGDSPIKEMVPFIAKKDKRVAAFVIGIAKKESDFGKASPSKDGQTCYNYWGYKGQGSRGTSMGYSCFGSPEESVEIVSKRISDLVDKKLNTPSKLVVWKCGSSCEGHDPIAVQKWISDVNQYFSKIVAFNE
jgi:hypothetical protein